VVYLADHPASALLEVMVHLEIDAEDLPTHFQLLGIEVPDDIPVATLTALPDNWREQIDGTRARGDAWLRGNEGALLRVPSAILPNTANYLLNPAHPEARRIVLDSATRAAFDPRLMAFLKS